MADPSIIGQNPKRTIPSKSARIDVRVTEDQKQRFTAKATQLGFRSPSTLMRALALNLIDGFDSGVLSRKKETPLAPETLAAIEQLRQDIRAAGFDLNNLARDVNAAAKSGEDAGGIAGRGAPVLNGVSEVLEHACWVLGGTLRDIESKNTDRSLSGVRSQCLMVGFNLRQIIRKVGDDMPTIRRLQRSLDEAQELLGGVRQP